VVIVRSVTSRVTTGDSVTAVTAYYDVQDFQVLYFTRKSIVSRFNQPDFQRVKASTAEGKVVRGEVIAILSTLETQGMLQAVEQLAPQVVVQRNVSDRSRFDVFIPVNVVPGLHVIASNIQAGTQFDSFTA
jgi:phage tail sheath gpL-like